MRYYFFSSWKKEFKTNDKIVQILDNCWWKSGLPFSCFSAVKQDERR